MKKFLLIILALISVICVSFTFGGCGNETDETINVRGQFYLLDQAYENGWLNEDDLKSIACCYYDSYNYEENPYSGKLILTEEMTANMEIEIKQAFLEQIAKFAEGDRELVYITCYFGTYNRNVIIRIHSDYICFDPIIEKEFYIDGVLFKNFWQGDIRVYHID